ncbi:MAG: rod shape-determining protein MreC [Candidatus Omnitrophica bacterium]|nr:rod shape-determining protein MreC [Candidatus Omnitrophota bacterium]MCM8790790.1 rod shape-determining protein MreC [Candidatus Omnitrophota bacterium]
MRSQKNKIFRALLLAILFAFLLINSRTIYNPIRTAFSDISAAPLRALNDFKSALRRMLPFASLREENRILRERIELLNRRIEEAKFIAEENNRLKDLLAFRKEVPYSTVAAQVIGRDPTNWSNSIIIDKGARHGVQKGKAVLSTRGLVGRVLEIGRYSAKVLLVTDPNSKVGVLIQRTREGGILVGRSDGTCKMVYITPDSDVKNGDRVITAGLGTTFPKGILVGEVMETGKEPGRLYKYAIVKTSQNMSKLEEVLCIR